MKIADAHCDTIFAFIDNPFNSDDAAWNIDKFQKVNGVLQYSDICVLSPYHGDSALRIAVSTLGNVYNKMDDRINILYSAGDFDDSKINIVLALEGAAPVIDDISNLYAFHKLGIRAITLTWNHRNFIADGISVGSNSGLTNFGKEFIKEMQKLNMIIDVSHLNESGFKDVANILQIPFAATHSNAFQIYNHPRNLKDYQIKEIIEHDGFIGLNFYSELLDNSEDNEMLKYKFLKHVEHFLNLNAENHIGFGADFDGIDRSPFPDVLSYPKIIELFQKELKVDDKLIEKIAYRNLLNFTFKVL